MAKSPSNKKRLRPILLVLGLFIIAGAVLAALELTNTTHLLHARNVAVAPTASSDTKGEVATTTTKTQQATDTSKDIGQSTTQPGDSKSDSGSDTPINLLTPSGNFVSAHTAVPATASLASVCNTTPGVNCQINFTLDGVTKSLPIQATDRGGSTYWNSWTPKSIGLTAGKWQVQAVASKGSQSQSTTDALDLEVTQ